MSPRRDVFVALSCLCLVLSFMDIQAKNVPETAVSKRDISDWVSYFDDLLYDYDSDEDTETILACRNCTVLVRPLPASAAAPGSATNNVAPGTNGPVDSAAVSSAAPNPATVVPPASANPVSAAPSTAQSPASAAAQAAQGPLPAVLPAAANSAPAVSPGAPSSSPTDTAGTAPAPPAASSTAPAGS